MKLANLLMKGSLRGLATATPANVATHEMMRTSSLSTVAKIAVAKSPNTAACEPTQDPDRFCWPHSIAMNTVELDTFTKRLAWFTGKGMGLEDAERMADKLVKRDRTLDDRRLCLECTHLAGQSGAVWHCKNWMSVGVASKVGDARLTTSLVLQLKRCDGFTIHF